MREIADKAEVITNPPGVDWQSPFTSRFVGAMPTSITEIPRMLVLAPDTVTSEPDGSYVVQGYFEYSADGTFANLGRVSGTLHPGTREFVLRDHSSKEAWVFAGTISPNGRVIYLRITYEGSTTDTFPLVHEDTFADLLPSDPA